MAGSPGSVAGAPGGRLSWPLVVLAVLVCSGYASAAADEESKTRTATETVDGIGDEILDRERPPNIVIIYADDLGWTDLGSYGSDYYKTPNIDELASDGALFRSAYANAPNCGAESSQSVNRAAHAAARNIHGCRVGERTLGR